MREQEIDRIRKLAEAATPGPWFAHHSEHPTMRSASSCVTVKDGCPIATEIHAGSADRRKANADLIAALDPQTVLAILADNQRLRAALQELARAAIAYDAAIQACANDPEMMASHCTAEGDTLDDLYAAWITAARKALSGEAHD